MSITTNRNTSERQTPTLSIQELYLKISSIPDEDTYQYLLEECLREQRELYDLIFGRIKDDFFSYNRFKHTGLRDAAWFCDLFSRVSPAE